MSILFRYTPGVGRVAALDCCGASGSGSNLTSTTATAFSTSSQTLVAGTAANIAHDTVPFSYGITTVTGANGYFQVPATGIYKIIPSIQYLTAGNGTLIVWVKVNGNSVPNTATFMHVPNNQQSVFTTEFLLELNANDQVQIWGLAGSQNCVVTYLAAGGSGANSYPAAPGIITNMYRIR